MSAARMRVVARIAPAHKALSPYVALSVVLHLGFLATMLFLPSLRPTKAFPMEPSIEAILMPAPAQRKATPPQPTAPVVEAEPEPEVEAADEDPPEPQPDPNPPAKPTVKPKPTPKKVAQPEPKPPAAKAKPSKPATSGNDGPVGNPEGADALVGMGSEFNWYRDAIARALYSSWRQPVLNAAEPLEVAVAFEIVKSGAVRNVRLERESGLATVDRSVLRAVHEATLPPLPRNYSRGVQPAMFVFRLYPE